jgi:hypothetical protein
MTAAALRNCSDVAVAGSAYGASDLCAAAVVLTFRRTSPFYRPRPGRFSSCSLGASRTPPVSCPCTAAGCDPPPKLTRTSLDRLVRRLNSRHGTYQATRLPLRHRAGYAPRPGPLCGNGNTPATIGPPPQWPQSTRPTPGQHPASPVSARSERSVATGRAIVRCCGGHRSGVVYRHTRTGSLSGAGTKTTRCPRASKTARSADSNVSVPSW